MCGKMAIGFNVIVVVVVVIRIVARIVGELDLGLVVAVASLGKGMGRDGPFRVTPSRG